MTNEEFLAEFPQLAEIDQPIGWGDDIKAMRAALGQAGELPWAPYLPQRPAIRFDHKGNAIQ